MEIQIIYMYLEGKESKEKNIYFLWKISLGPAETIHALIFHPVSNFDKKEL